jgi:8-oxo-dGTP pyrophosphatase MutT (NUDIX family)
MEYFKKMRSYIGSEQLLLVGISVLLIDQENRVLLLHRSDTNDWGVPGGYMEIGETLEEAARREVREETGLELNELIFYKVFSGPGFAFTYPNGDEVYNVVICYLSRDFTGEIKLDHESSGYKFFKWVELPGDIMRHSRIVLEDFIGNNEHKN